MRAVLVTRCQCRKEIELDRLLEEICVPLLPTLSARRQSADLWQSPFRDQPPPSHRIFRLKSPASEQEPAIYQEE